MNHLIFTLIIISLFCTSTYTATAMIQTETHFEKSCINTRGYWVPQEKYNTNIYSEEVWAELSTLEENKEFIAIFYKENKIDELIKLYLEWCSDINHSELLKVIIFPDRILGYSTSAIKPDRR